MAAIKYKQTLNPPPKKAAKTVFVGNTEAAYLTYAFNPSTD